MHKIVFLGAFVAALTTFSAEYYVDVTRPDDAGAATNWATAKQTIQAAIDVASSSDTVWVTNGIYDSGSHLFADGQTPSRILITNSIAVKSVNGSGHTFIDGRGEARCVYMIGGAELLGFTLTNGVTSVGNINGAGVLCGNGAVILDCVVTKCSNSYYGKGGGIYSEGDETTISNTVITECSGQKDGGGVYNGTLWDCTLSNNSVWGTGGGCYGSILHNCVLTGNRNRLNHGGGAGISTLYNCLLTNNVSGTTGGGAYSSTLINCTVVKNRGSRGGGVSYSSIKNSIVYDNDCGASSADDNYYSGNMSYSCSFPEESGTGNITNKPRFIAESPWGYRLMPGSPCIDSGDNSIVVGASDLDGNSRIDNGSVDMGAYEQHERFPWIETTTATLQFTSFLHNSPSAQSLTIWNGAVDTLNYMLSTSTPWIAVSPTGGSSTGEQDQISIQLDTSALVGGVYTGHVSIVATNAPNAPQTVAVHLVVNDYHYVNISNATPASPYTDWSSAATTIQDAVDQTLDGDIVLVADGTYDSGGMMIGSLSNRVAITNSIEVRSVNGPLQTIIKGNGLLGSSAARCVYMETNTLLGGFTILSGGTLTDGSEGADQSGGGIWCNDDTAVITNCIITSNAASADGGGIYRGTIYRCEINNNVSGDQGGGSFRSTLNNALVIENQANEGGGVYDGILNSCTVSKNYAPVGAGTYGGTINNSVLADNWQTEERLSEKNYYQGDINYSCATPQPSGTANIAGPPVFMNSLRNDFYLSHLSPCLDAGDNGFSLGAIDLDGNPRIVNDIVDMGAFEFQTVRPWLAVLDLDMYFSSFLGESPSNQTFQVRNAGISNLTYSVFANVPWIQVVPESGSSTGEVDDISVVISSEDLMGGMHTGIVSVTSGDVSNSPQEVLVYLLINDTHYVDVASSNPVPPYTSWSTASTVIQDAVDETHHGDMVLVASGTYETGGAITPGYSLTNRVCVTNAITIRSLNGPEVTFIKGELGSNGGCDVDAVRCVFMDDNARLSGFTVTNGYTINSGNTQFERSGGGIWLTTNCVVSGCILSGNYANRKGGGVYLSGQGTLNNCEFHGNSAYDGGGAYLYNGGTLNNCIMTGNSSTSIAIPVSGGGAVFLDEGGVLNNCTLSENSASRRGGGARLNGKGTLNNCIVWNNTAGNDGDDIFKFSYGGVVRYTCASDGVSHGGGGCITNDPFFVEREGRTLQLRGGSPCIDAGNNVYAPTNETPYDLDGNLRIIGSQVDMGCFELDPATLVKYYVDASRSDDNGVATNWATAKRTIQAAVDLTENGNVVWVTNGVYDIGGAVTPSGSLTNRVCITTAITVQSVNGPNVTIIEGAAGSNGSNDVDSVRGVFMTNNCSLTGFTITGGYSTGSGGGIWLTDNCVVSNCTLTGNWARDDGGGACLYYGGTLNNCTLNENSANADSGFAHGGGAYLYYGGTLNHCLLIRNSANGVYEGIGGGASLFSGGTLNTCTLIGNSASSEGGGVFLFSDGTLNNCTLSENSANYGGGARFLSGGRLNNCVVWHNTASSAGNEIYNDSGVIYRTSYTSDPFFADATNGNFQLQAGSLCISMGDNAYAPAGTDLAGNPRIINGTVDAGAYEFYEAEGDFDEDGLPNEWEALYFGNITNGVKGTTCSNTINTVWEAYIAGLDPTDPHAVFLMSILPGRVLQWPCVSGRVYSVQWTTNLQESFQLLETNIPWTTEVFTDRVHGVEDHGYYKIKVQLK